MGRAAHWPDDGADQSLAGARTQPRAQTQPGAGIAQVLLDSSLPQLDHLFDYAIPESMRAEIRAGQRVKVPFRSHRSGRFGTIVSLTDSSSFSGELADISEIISPVSVLTPEVWRLARAVATRAAGSAGDILRLAIPPRQVRVEKQFLAGSSDSDPSMQDQTGPTDEADARNATLLISGMRLAFSASHGLVRLTTGEWVRAWAAALAKSALAVYETGKSAILIVPDYRDLDQVRDTLVSLGHRSVIRVDSKQSNADRYRNFLRALSDGPKIILGNRSAVYAPARDLGAIFVWDDGDPVLAEPRAPYVHARDAALLRAEQQGAGLMFASHSRSAEVQRLIEIGYVRVHDSPQKRTRIVHSGSLTTGERLPGRIPEIATRLLREGLQTGPVLVQVSTPGYAPISVCSRCHDLARCNHCAGPIGFEHARKGSCRWCGVPATSWRCGSCGDSRLEVRGAGSERTAEQFQRMFPETRVLVSDGAQPRSVVDARPTLTVATRGTEPVAVGGYHAIVLLDVERLLGLETLRAGEDCLRWWENAAALAAPGATCVIAGGGGAVVQAFVTGRSEEWLRRELSDRTELRYPPAVRVASVTGGAREVDKALEAIGDLPEVDALGPTAQGDDRVRAIVRFPYAAGHEVATRLRAALIADAMGSSSQARTRDPKVGPRKSKARTNALRLRFDDRGVFDQVGE